MITIDLSTTIVDLAGTEITPRESYGQAVANFVLARSSKGPAMKFMEWARKLYANEPLSLDGNDYVTFHDAVRDSEILTNFVKGPVLAALINAKAKEVT